MAARRVGQEMTLLVIGMGLYEVAMLNGRRQLKNRQNTLLATWIGSCINGTKFDNMPIPKHRCKTFLKQSFKQWNQK